MKITQVLCVVLIYPAFSWAQNPWKDVYSENAWSQRDTWQKPDSIIALLALDQNSSVADIGSHQGYFTIKLGRVMPTGIIYAVDISSKRLDQLEEIAARRGISNVRAILASPDNPKLPPAAVDAALIVDTYHEIRDHQAFLKNLKRGLKPGARIVICEPVAEERKGQSRETQFRKHELESRYALEDLRKAGLRLLFFQENFIDRTREKGDSMWIIVAEMEQRKG